MAYEWLNFIINNINSDGTPRYLGVEVDDHPIDQTRYIGKESLVVPEKHAEGFRIGD